MFIRSRAPVRIDFAGGWTDVSLFTEDSPGKVVNAAVTLYSYATIRLKGKENEMPPGKLERTLDLRIRIYSADFDKYIEAEDIRKFEYDGNIDLVKAAIRKMRILEGGFDLITQSTAPPGSGLGTSAAMGVALIGSLSKMLNDPLLPSEVAEFASSIERFELNIRGGKQDQYASALGGINFMEFKGEDVKVSPLRLPADVICELEKNLVLCYTGKSRLSGDIHGKVVANFKRGDRSTREALSNLKEIAESVKRALLRGRLEEFGELLEENWRNQKALHPSITNERTEELYSIAKKFAMLYNSSVRSFVIEGCRAF